MNLEGCVPVPNFPGHEKVVLAEGLVAVKGLFKVVHRKQRRLSRFPGGGILMFANPFTPTLPMYIIPTKIAWLKPSRKSPIDLKISPLKIKIMIGSNPLKSTMLVRGLAVIVVCMFCLCCVYVLLLCCVMLCIVFVFYVCILSFAVFSLCWPAVC